MRSVTLATEGNGSCLSYCSRARSVWSALPNGCPGLSRRHAGTSLLQSVLMECVMRRMIIGVAAIMLMIASADAQNPSPDELAARNVQRRAVEAMIWAMPAVNADLMLQAMLGSTKAKVNEIVYWSRPVNWKNQTLTPNPDAIYLMSFWNVKEGPIVIEIPPAQDGSIAGNIVTAWQMPL